LVFAVSAFDRHSIKDKTGRQGTLH
jgi:hypothetical protein